MHKHNSRRQGFTIVELLIVIVVIAILAAISIVAYTGIQSRAYDSAVQSDLKNIGGRFLEFYTIEGRLPGMNSSDLSPMNLQVARNSYGYHYTPVGEYNLGYCPDSVSGTFILVAASKSGSVFVFKQGAVTHGAGPLVSLAGTCNNNGLPSSTGDWFYRSGWNASVGG